MNRLIKTRLIDGESGAALVMTALTITVLLGISAFAVDLGAARAATRQAQAGVDGGSLAAAQDLPLAVANATTSANARDLAAQYAATSMFQDTVPAVVEVSTSGNTETYTVGVGDEQVTLIITSPYTQAGSKVKPFNLIHVKACRPTGTFFASAIGATVKNVCREGVARRQNITGGFDIGLLALDGDDCKSLEFGGNSNTNLVPAGSVVVNSDCASQALIDQGTSWELDTSFIGVVGGQNIGCDDCVDVEPQTGFEPIPDPLVNMPEPGATGALAPVPLTTFTDCAAVGSGPATVKVCSPGRYPSGLALTPHPYIFRPGLYYIEDEFSLPTGGSKTVCLNAGTDPNVSGPCDGVTFFIAGPDGSVNWNGNGDVSLPAPTATTCTAYLTCDYVGVSIFQSRTLTTEMTINGSANFSIGSIYAPAAHLKLNGTAGPSGTDEIGITGVVVANTIDISGTFDLDIQVVAPLKLEDPEDDYGLEN